MSRRSVDKTVVERFGLTRANNHTRRVGGDIGVTRMSSSLVFVRRPREWFRSFYYFDPSYEFPRGIRRREILVAPRTVCVRVHPLHSISTNAFPFTRRLFSRYVSYKNNKRTRAPFSASPADRPWPPRRDCAVQVITRNLLCARV